MPRHNRNKVVSIRFSVEEYEQIQTLCVTEGADTISELARRAVKQLVLQKNVADTASTVESRMDEIHAHISVLDREVARLSDVMGIGRIETDSRQHSREMVRNDKQST